MFAMSIIKKVPSISISTAYFWILHGKEYRGDKGIKQTPDYVRMKPKKRIKALELLNKLKKKGKA